MNAGELASLSTQLISLAINGIAEALSSLMTSRRLSIHKICHFHLLSFTYCSLNYQHAHMTSA